MDDPIFLDTETIGLHGVICLLQYAVGEGEVKLELLWHKTIDECCELLEKIINNPGGVIAFNINFDWFHVTKFYLTLLELKKKEEYLTGKWENTELQDLLVPFVFAEKDARDGPCVKPHKACDIMLVARKGPYQSTMDRKAIRIKRIPTVLADKVANELEKRIILKDIYFARRKDKNTKKWKVYDIIENKGSPDERINPDFKNVVLKFASSSALKVLAADALNLPLEEVIKYSDIEVPRQFWPEELGYAPYAFGDPLVEASYKDGNGWRKTWPTFLRMHIKHWENHTLARLYAKNDIVYLRELYKFFGSPELGDDDSELACMIPACRWKGFAINVESLKELKRLNKEKIKNTPTAPVRARAWLEELMSDAEKLGMGGSTKKVVLQTLSKLQTDCPDCQKVDFSLEDDYRSKEEKQKVCSKCNGKGVIEHPVALRAKAILEARIAQYEIGLFDKLIQAGRLHADFKTIGTLSGRMAGGRDKGVEAGGRIGRKGDGLNPQGIPRKKEIRKAFTLSFDPIKYPLCGGDFDAFEVTLADSAYNDSLLRQELCTCGECGYVCTIEEYQGTFCPQCKKCGASKKGKPCGYQLTQEEFDSQSCNVQALRKQKCPKCGESESTRKKIHGIFATQLFPDKTYQQVLASKGTNFDMYDLGKRGVFSTIYGGDHNTIKEKLGVPLEDAEAAYQRWICRFTGVGIAQKRVFDAFCSMRQPGGIGSQVVWHDPADYMESLLGFRRYFILENQICKALYDMGNKPPKDWRGVNIKVQRRERLQTVSGAVQSALYGAAFQIQAAAMRAAKNHEIQSAGAQITKFVQRKVWDLQPPGCHEWRVQQMNIHDEVMCITRRDYVDKVEEAVYAAVETFRFKVPLIKISWKIDLKNWGEK